MSRLVDLIGKRFGRWLILERATNGTGSQPHWLCRCDCGAEKRVAGQSLRSGKSTSCGCARGEQVAARNTTHGMSDTPEWAVWSSMHQRCTNKNAPAFADYGARGIYVCDRWNEFDAFIEDMGRRPSDDHTIERVENDGPYAPWNCVWATREDQARNRRSNRTLRLAGIAMPVVRWAELLRVPYGRLLGRLERGWGAELTLTFGVDAADVIAMATAYCRERGLPAPAPVVEAAKAAGGEAA